MGWLIYGIGLVLVGLGGLGVWTGAPIIQLERGWALVIAGSVVFAAGWIVIGLGVVAQRLGRIVKLIGVQNEAASALSLRALEPATDDHFALAADAEPEPVTVSADATVEPDPQPAESPSRQGLWKRVRREAPVRAERTEPAVEQRLADDLVAVIPVPPVPVAAPPVTAPSPERTKAHRVDWLNKRTARDAEPAPDTVSAPTRETEEAPFTMRPTLGGDEFATPAHQEASAPQDSSASQDPSLDRLFQMEETPKPSVSEQELTVVGRYQAGVASYVMYSDGTIAVETDGETVRRFASMDELKRFIAERELPDVPGAEVR